MVWTNIPKPVGPTYTNVNPMGREQYDQSSLTYDDTNTFYDGFSPNMWTNVSKPTLGAGIMWSEAGMPWSEAGFSWDSSEQWTRVAKPS